MQSGEHHLRARLGTRLTPAAAMGLERAQIALEDSGRRGIACSRAHWLQRTAEELRAAAGVRAGARCIDRAAGGAAQRFELVRRPERDRRAAGVPSGEIAVE